MTTLTNDVIQCLDTPVEPGVFGMTVIIEQFGIQEIFCDGFGNYRINKGIVRCAGYTETVDENGVQKIAIVRLIFPLEAVEGAKTAFTRANKPRVKVAVN